MTRPHPRHIPNRLAVTRWGLVVSRTLWLISRNEYASKEIFVATGILVFYFELFVGVRCDLLGNAILAACAALCGPGNNRIGHRNCSLAVSVREDRLGCLGHSAWINNIPRPGLIGTGHKSR